MLCPREWESRMYGMINRAVERFVRDTYGRDTWVACARSAGLDFTEFEPMLLYDSALTDRVLNAVAGELGKDRSEILEDIGTYLVSHPKVEAIRRLMRFRRGRLHRFPAFAG